MESFYQQIASGQFLTLIQYAGLPLKSWSEYPTLKPVNFFGQIRMVNPNYPDCINHDLIKRSIEWLRPRWTSDLLLIDLEFLPKASNPSVNQLLGRSVQCLCQPEEWTEKRLNAAFVKATMQVERTAEILNSITETIRKVAPEMQLAHFGTCPSTDTCAIYSSMANRVGKCLVHHAEAKQWLYQLYLWSVDMMKLQAELIAPTVDWYAPCEYLDGNHGYFANTTQLSQFADDVTGTVASLHSASQSEKAVWNYSTLIGLTLARGILPEKPLIPFLSPQWWQSGHQAWSHGYGRELVSPQLMRDQLDFIRPLCDSLALWCQHEKYNKDPDKFYNSATFREVRMWARQRARSQGYGT